MIEGEIIRFVVWLTLLIVISFALEQIWFRIFPGRGYQLIIFPGVVIHEFSHAFGCFLSGAKIDEISLFSSKGSYVKHGKPKLPLVGNFIISFAPIAGGITSLWATTRLLGLGLPQIETAPSFNLIRELIRFITKNLESWPFWLFVYLTVSIIICLVPSKQDLKNSTISALFILVAIFLINQFGLLSFDGIFSVVSRTLAVGVFFGFIALTFSFPVFLIKKLI